MVAFTNCASFYGTFDQNGNVFQWNDLDGLAPSGSSRRLRGGGWQSDAAIGNLREFFERFRRLNIRSSPELDALVAQAQQTINGVEPQTLRDSNRLRQMVANDFTRIEAAVEELLVDRPRRSILRRAQTGGAA